MSLIKPEEDVAQTGAATFTKTFCLQLDCLLMKPQEEEEKLKG